MITVFEVMVLIAMSMVIGCAIGSLVTPKDNTVKKRSVGLIRDVVHQMVAEQQERKEILETFHKMEDQLVDIKRELKERNTLLHDTKGLQRKLKSLVKEFKNEVREQSKVDVKNEPNRFKKSMKNSSKTLRKEMKIHEQTIKKKMSSTYQRLKKFLNLYEKNVERKMTKNNQRISQVKQKSLERIKVINNKLVVLQNQFGKFCNTLL